MTQVDGIRHISAERETLLKNYSKVGAVTLQVARVLNGTIIVAARWAAVRVK